MALKGPEPGGSRVALSIRGGYHISLAGQSVPSKALSCQSQAVADSREMGVGQQKAVEASLGLSIFCREPTERSWCSLSAVCTKEASG